MKTQSFDAYTIEEVGEKLAKLQTSDFQPTLAIVFASIKYNLPELSAVFSQQKIDLFACSSAGEIQSGEVIEEQIVVLVMDMKKEYYELCRQETGDKTTYQIANDIGKCASRAFENPAVFVLSGGVETDAEQIIFGLKDAVQKEIPIYGGLAGDDLVMKQTFVFTNDWMTNNGLLALVIDHDKIQVEGLAVSGWEAVGGMNRITKAKGNILYEINGEPALDVFMKYFGFYDNKKKNNVELETISGQYPLQVFREEGYSVLRSPLVANEKDKSLILAGGVKTGEEFKFSISPGFAVIEQTIEEFKFLKDKCPEVDAMIIVSCKGRHTAFGPMLDVEFEGIHEQWDVPLIGFLSYGEIGKVKKGSCEFHNITTTLITLKER